MSYKNCKKLINMIPIGKEKKVKVSGFKLLAIRPLINCDKQLLKNLNSGEIYRFYQDYDFILDKKGNEVNEIIHIPSTPDDLYGNNISISAVVGKNGSGKSSLIELFSTFVFCLSEQLNLIDISDFKRSHQLNKKDQRQLDTELKKFELFECEIYFLIENIVYRITKKANDFERVSFENKSTDNTNESSFKPDHDDSLQLSSLKLASAKNEFLKNSFFYSILANYSLYGLNTNETGIWLKSIFHKNDGYQTPIVLNPMRTEGKIDVNSLTYLSKSRLLLNVFKRLEDKQKEKDSLRNLVNNKIVDQLSLKLDYRKFSIVEDDSLQPSQAPSYVLNLKEKSIYLEYTEKYKKSHLKFLINAFYPNYTFQEKKPSSSAIKKVTIEYVLKKAYDIVKTYPQFKTYKNRAFRSNSKEGTIKECFSSLSNDYTHSTFKIRQALNFLIHDFYDFKNEINKSYQLTTTSKLGITDVINNNIDLLLKTTLEKTKKNYINAEKFIDIGEIIENNYKEYNLINFLPPSFFEIDFIFKEEGVFKDLSSGEKQMIYSINSIIYHLINLDSLSSIEIKDGISYKYFNIILDEIELYFHPEFQRIYIHELVKSINYLRKSNYKINIIFLTHSPFILSDIPSSNILKLKNGESIVKEQLTFGANIHDLLSNDFFLETSFMGAFAKQKIEAAVSFLNFNMIEKRIDSLIANEDDNDQVIINTLINEKLALKERIQIFDKSFHKGIIDLIGEPIIKNKLLQMYDEVFESENRKDVKEDIRQLALKAGLDINFNN
jgi:predicted ATPase